MDNLSPIGGGLKFEKPQIHPQKNT